VNVARYRLSGAAFLNPSGTTIPRYFKAGDEIEYDGIPGRAFIPLDDAARAASLRAGIRAEDLLTKDRRGLCSVK
jgi:hypothetical protein